MAKVVKMCDMPIGIAAKVFEMLNPGRVSAKWYNEYMGFAIITDVEPKDLTYPEGWYYAKGNYRNKHKSSTGIYEEIRMMKTNGKFWDVPYCTLNMD